MLGTAGTSAGQEASKASITFNDQTSNGISVIVEKIETDVEVRLVLRDQDSNVIGGPITFDAGTVVEDYEVKLTPQITETKTLSANLYESGGSNVARKTAEITVSDPAEMVSGMGPTFVEANPDAGFNYPYYLYAPSRPTDSDPGSILVQPNNSGQATDDFEVQRQSAQNRIEGGISRTVSERLTVPLLIPVFPRPQTDPVDWRHYVHALDRQTMQISDGPLKRVDLQLLRMVDHAQEMLSDQSYTVDDQILLNGFSAAGNFVDRFAVLHPDRVRSVTAGGLNGMAMLPLEEAKGHTLNFHIGIADVEELTGEPVDLDALNEVNQFLFMGGEDSNDTIPYDDAWSEEMREIALDVYGEKMVTERFPYCQSAYEQAGVDAQFKVYEGVAHSPRSALEDIIEFHQRSLDREDVSDFNQDLGFEPKINYTAEQPEVGESIEFDASSTEISLGQILAYTWEFPNGETAAGKTVTHRFEKPGQYGINLSVIDNNGRTVTTEATVSIGGDSKQTVSGTNDSSESTSEATTETDQQTSAGPRFTLPGVGLGVVVTSAAGGLYSLKNRLQD
ncbi:PKD domain-containing protein [Halostella litorea]|uniref:PKD domain-containing protein n=1 Tax=Halostella litorea TaxID=2528831 RepID=UPI001386A634|nr:PKD domain-containing protein [Halostella litorea]